MKSLLILCVSLLVFSSTEGKAQSLEITSEGQVQVYNDEGQIDEELNARRPSCAIVKHRLQEYFKRANEAEDFLDWYNPEKMEYEQAQALLNLLRRTPYFNSDRQDKFLRVFFQWRIPRDAFELLAKNQILPKRILRETEVWNDPINGLLPSDYTFDIYERQTVIAQFSMRTTYETYCLQTTKTQLLIETKDLAVNFTGIHDPEAL